MNRRMIIAAAAFAALSLADAQAGALADLIKSRMQEEWPLSPQTGIASTDGDTPQRATGWTSSDSSDVDPLVTKTRIGSDDVRPGVQPSVEPVQQGVPVASEPAVTPSDGGTPTSGAAPTVSFGVEIDPWVYDRMAQLGYTSAGSPYAQKLNADEGMYVNVQQSAQQKHDAAFDAYQDLVVGMSDSQRQNALQAVKFFGQRDYNVSIESVSRESAGAVSGGLIDSTGAVIGTVQFKTSNVRQGSDGEAICDLTVQQTDLNGKRTVSKMKGVSVSEVAMGDQGLNAAFVPTTVGGVLPAGEKFFCVDFTAGFGQLNVITDLLPMAEPIHCDAKGKWKFDKAAKVKFVKGKDGAYSLTVDNMKGKTNTSKLKLTYKPKTGVFKGSFKLYSIGGTSARPKLVTKTVKVAGLVVNGIGSGTATVSGTDLVWPVFIFN